MRILYLAHRVPYAPDRGDRIRAYHTLRFLVGAGHEVHVFALAHDDEEEARAERLKDICHSWTVTRVPRRRNLARAVPALATSSPLTHVLLDAPQAGQVLRGICGTFRPELVFALCSGVAKWAIEPPLAGLPLILDLVDVDSAKWADYAAGSAGPVRWIYTREGRRLREFERHAAAWSRATLVVNEREAAIARSVAPEGHVVVIGNGVDTAFFAPPRDIHRQPDVVFTAVFDYRPNEEGALWFATHVWPLVRAARRDARLLLVGARPTSAVRALASAEAGIVVTGTVPDVREYLWNARVAIAPLFIARGTQNKALEALAAGVQCVVTTAVFEGLPSPARAACSVADDPPGFAQAVLAGLEASDAAPLVPDALGWADALAGLDEVVNRAAGRAQPAVAAQ